MVQKKTSFQKKSQTTLFSGLVTILFDRVEPFVRHFVQLSGTAYAILVEGIMGNIRVKFPVVQEEIMFK